MKTTTLALAVAACVAAAGCADPTKGKPVAEVGEAKPEATPAATPETKTETKTTAVTAGAEKLRMDPAASKIGWKASKVTLTHVGGFRAFTGSVELVGGKAEGSKVAVEIEAGSIFSDNERLTGHLKSPDFFDVARFPKASFTSTAIAAGGKGGPTHTVTGNLTMHGVSKSVTFPATIVVTPTEVTASAELAVNRKLWGIVYPGAPDDLIGDNVLITFEIKAARTAKA